MTEVKCNFVAACSLEEAPAGLETYMPLYQVASEASFQRAGLPWNFWSIQDEDKFGAFSMEDAGVDVADLDRLAEQPGLFSVDCIPEDSHLTLEQQQQLKDLIEEFSDIFSTGADDLGCAQWEAPVKHDIWLQPGAEPVATRRSPTQYSQHENDFLVEQQKSLLEKGVIRESTSPWASAPVVVPKPDKTLRFCVDFRELNKVTMGDPYHLPVIEQLIQKMSLAKYFSCMDIVSAFWQVPMNPDHIQYTAFIAPNGKYEWIRMPFGLKNASTTFQRLIDAVLRGHSNATAYVDDSFVFSKTFEEHLVHLREAFTRFRKAHIKLKLPKCIFVALQIKCLGNVISEGEVRPDPGKLMAIKNMPEPTDATGVRRFLGATGYYRNYVDGFADVTAVLSELQQKNVKFVWSEKCSEAVKQLKEMMCSEPVLRLADFSRPFILTTDWSIVAVGAVLSQIDPETGRDHPIAYASRLLSKAERNYAPTEGECLAIVWAIQKFRYYLHGRSFTVYTDHTALTWLHTNRFTNSKLERWSLKLQEYDFVIKYKRGEDNAVADCLSRLVAPGQLEELAPEDYDIPSLPVAKFMVQALTHHAFSVAPHLYGLAVPRPAVSISELRQRKDIDGEPCDVCGMAKGYDNLVYCTSCERCFHLRCLVPPRSIPPSGDWFCPACDPFAVWEKGGLSELEMQDTPLQYHPQDPYRDEPLMDFLRSGEDPHLLEHLSAEERKEVRRKAQQYKLHPGLEGWLLVLRASRDSAPRWLVCPPLEFRWDIIALFHDASGHAGINRTYHLLHMHFAWLGMRHDVGWFVSTCDACQRVKATHPSPLPLSPPEIHGPMQHVHIDLTGPFPRFVEGVSQKAEKLWIVCMIDYFTKVVEVTPIAHKDALTLAKTFYYQWICRYGVPSTVTSDNGMEFSTHFTHMLARLRVDHVHTSVNHPSANGAVERFNRSLKDMITSHYKDHPNDWVETLPHFRHAYMSLPHSALDNHCPYEMLFGQIPRLPTANRQILLSSCLTVSFLSCQEHVQQIQDRKLQLQHQAELCIRKLFHRNAAARRLLQESRRTPGVLTEGGYALEITPVHHPLHTGVRGPFRIKRLYGHLALLETGAVLGRATQLVQRHISHLVPYTPPFVRP